MKIPQNYSDMNLLFTAMKVILILTSLKSFLTDYLSCSSVRLSSIVCLFNLAWIFEQEHPSLGNPCGGSLKELPSSSHTFMYT